MIEPRRVGSSHMQDISDHIFPWHDGHPVLARLEGTNDLFLPLFSTNELLDDAMRLMGVTFESTKQIDDPVQFLDSLPLLYAGVRLRVILDPHRTPEGMVRYTEIIRATIN